MAIPYCDEARAASGTCEHLSLYGESEITSLVPQASSSFRSFAVRILPATESWTGAWEQDYTLLIRYSSLVPGLRWAPG